MGDMIYLGGHSQSTFNPKSYDADRISYFYRTFVSVANKIQIHELKLCVGYIGDVAPSSIRQTEPSGRLGVAFCSTHIGMFKP